MSLAPLLGLVLAASPVGNPGETGTCASTTLLSGDPAATSAVGSALRRHGIHDTPAVGCSPLRVAIVPSDAGLRLELLGPRGGVVTDRLVATADTAAVLIESWLRTDIAAPLLAARLIDDGAADTAQTDVPPAAATPIAPPAALPAPSAALVQAATAPGAPSPSSPVGLSIAGEAVLARDGSRAAGAAFGSCVRVRSLCVGLGLRLMRVWPVSPIPDVSRGLDGVSGYGGDAMAAAELAVRLGPATLRPGAAIGAGWIGTRGVIVEHSGYYNAFGPRAEARLALDWPLARDVAIELSVGGGLGSTATVDRVANTRDRPLFVSDAAPTLHGGLGIRYGGAAP